MASNPAAQVLSSAVDLLGASIVTATRNATSSRLGAFYDNTTIAAGAPVHIHQISSTQMLAAFSRRWTTATPSTSNPGFFSDYTEHTTPSWFILGPSGARTLIDNTPVIPIVTPVDSAVLNAGTSVGTPYLYLLHSVTQGAQTSGLLQHFRVATGGRLVPVAEEVIPNLSAQGVSFDKGISTARGYLTVYGTDSDGHVFTARKRWSAVGVNSFTSARNPAGGGSLAWQFGTGSGWDPNPVNAAPEPGLRSDGPLSAAGWRKTLYLSTVQAASGGNMNAQIFTQLRTRSWVPLGTPIQGWDPGAVTAAKVPLGSTADGSYLGGTLQLQPSLGVPPTIINTPASETAFPYLTTTKVVTGVEHSLQVAWNALQIPRQI
jgi:hypothetical protein